MFIFSSLHAASFKFHSSSLLIHISRSFLNFSFRTKIFLVILEFIEYSNECRKKEHLDGKGEEYERNNNSYQSGGTA